MGSMKACRFGLLLIVSSFAFEWSAAGAALIQFAGHASEVVISEVSERTIRIQLFPLGADDRPIPPAPSTILVSFPSTERWRARQLADTKEVQLSKVDLRISAQPLT